MMADNPSRGNRRNRHSTRGRSSGAPDAVVPGVEVELDVTNVAHGGVFVARHEGRVVFVADTLPGERVLARVSDDRHASFWRAETVRVIEPAPQRRAHIWPEAGIERAPERRAGGAEFGHIDLDFQRELKRRVLVDALQRFGGIDAESGIIAGLTVEPVPPADGAPADADVTGGAWRTRLRLQVGGDGGVVGPYAARSHTVIPVESIPLAVAAIAEIAPLRQRFPDAAGIDLLAPSGQEARIIVLERDAKGRPRRVEDGLITERVGERSFRLDAGGFWQVHSRAAQTLTSAVQDAVDDDLFDARAANLDLYGGVGLLAAAVGDRFGDAVHITSVESDPRATDNAAENLAEWVGAGAVTSRVDRFLAQLRAEASGAGVRRNENATVVLDPPRAGAGREVIDHLAALGPAQLVYVACDPVALARDTGLLRERGYEAVGIRAFDLFPNTHHLEAVARFVRVR